MKVGELYRILQGVESNAEVMIGWPMDQTAEPLRTVLIAHENTLDTYRGEPRVVALNGPRVYLSEEPLYGPQFLIKEAPGIPNNNQNEGEPNIPPSFYGIRPKEAE